MWNTNPNIMQTLSVLTKFKASKETCKQKYFQGFDVYGLCVVPRIIQRTIRAAVEHHFFELKTSIDQDLSSYDTQG